MKKQTISELIMSAFNYQKNVSADEISTIIEAETDVTFNRQQIMNGIHFLRKTGHNIITDGPKTDKRYTYVNGPQAVSKSVVDKVNVVKMVSANKKADISLLERIRHYVIALRIASVDLLLDTFDASEDVITSTMTAVAEKFNDVREEYKISLCDIDVLKLACGKSNDHTVERCMHLVVAMNGCSINNVADLLGISSSEARRVMIATADTYGDVVVLTHRLLAI